MTEKSVTITMTETQCGLLLGFLEELGDHFSCAGCNDFSMKLTADNQDDLFQLARNVEQDSMGEVDEPWLAKRLERAKSEGKLFFNDSSLLAHLRVIIAKSSQASPIRR